MNGILGGKPGLRNTTISAAARRRVHDPARARSGRADDRLGCGPPRARCRARRRRARAVDGGRRPGRFQPDAPVVQLRLEAFERVVGVRPLLIRSGGTLPIVPALEARGIPTILTGFALPSSNIHSPNERIPVRYFDAGASPPSRALPGVRRATDGSISCRDRPSLPRTTSNACLSTPATSRRPAPGSLGRPLGAGAARSGSGYSAAGSRSSTSAPRPGDPHLRAERAEPPARARRADPTRRARAVPRDRKRSASENARSPTAGARTRARYARGGHGRARDRLRAARRGCDTREALVAAAETDLERRETSVSSIWSNAIASPTCVSSTSPGAKKCSRWEKARLNKRSGCSTRARPSWNDAAPELDSVRRDQAEARRRSRVRSATGGIVAEVRRRTSACTGFRPHWASGPASSRRRDATVASRARGARARATRRRADERLGVLAAPRR